ncbi:hypothetical protein HY218_01295 [Candidatus Saccharibacteria bacterium]|nr:hypothetical protein [Candidatus Saccharibacteria bacterium]
MTRISDSEQAWVALMQARGSAERRDVNEFDNRANVLRLSTRLLPLIDTIDETMDAANPASVQAAHVALDALTDL